MTGISDFVIIFTDCSHCPKCERYVALIQDREMRSHKPQFYVCWACQLVFELGKGLLKES